MKTLLLLIISLSFITNNALSNIVYVDNFDAVYPWGNTTWDLDIDGEGNTDIRLYQISGSGLIFFGGFNNVYGQNKVQCQPITSSPSIDCTGDTLNSFTTLWNNNADIWDLSNAWSIGVGSHKQGIRLIKTNPANGLLGFLYGYIDYSFTASNDVIIHGWYYEDNFSVPIIANTLLDYPFDSNCIHYDTTFVTVYDTIYTTVTDTLIINVNEAGNPLLNLTTIKVYPNPTNDQITINNGDFALLNNYEIKIENDLGQIVFSSLINQQTFIIDLSSLGAVGLYYLILYDDTGNLITTRKLVLN